MAGLFDIEPEDVRRLDALQLTKLLECLVSNELAEHNVRRTNAYTSLEINIPDDGADGLVWITADAMPEMAHIPARVTVFQAKSGARTSDKFVNELFVARTKRKRLKPLIEEALRREGAYIVFYNRPCKTVEKNKRIKAMHSAIQAAYPDSKPLKIEIYDASEIAQWTNRYLPAIIRTAKSSGRVTLDEFMTWDTLSGYDLYENAFIDNGQAEDFKSTARATFSRPREAMRLVGQSGLGKTRLVIEAFRPPASGASDPDQRLLSNTMVYVNSAGDYPIAARIRQMRDAGISGTVVVDDCNSATHDRLLLEIQHKNSKLSLLSIDYHVDDYNPQPGEYRLKKATLDTLKGIIAEAHPSLNQYQLELIAKFADGYPRIAARLSEAPLEERVTFGTDLEKSLVESLLWGRATPDADARRVIETLSLFTNVGFENAFQSERWYVAETLCGMSRQMFYEKAKFFVPRILDVIGDFVRVSPLPLAMRLVEQWYNKNDQSQQAALQTDERMPSRLRESLGERFSDLGELEQAREIARRLTDPNAPFGRAEVLNTEQGSRAFRSLAEVNPEAAVNALIREFGNMPVEQLQNNVGPGRRQLIWALEAIVFNRQQFIRGMHVLARFAVAENEDIGNNATAEFLHRFQWVLAGTEAEPDLRLQVIDNLLASDDERFVSLAIRALGRALVEGRGRMLGSERQGGRVLEDWRPKTYGEIHQYIDSAIGRLVPFAQRDDDLGNLARIRLGRSISHVLRYRPETIDKAIRTVTSGYRKAWPEAIDSVEWVLEHGLEGAADEVVSMASDWMKLLEPQDLAERVRLFVTTPPRGTLKQMPDGSYVNTSQERASDLAASIGPNRTEWKDVLRLVTSGQQGQAFAFGMGMGRLVPQDQQVAFADDAITALEEAENPNPYTLMGLISGYDPNTRANIKTILRHVVENPRVASMSGKVMAVAGPDEEDVRQLLPLLETRVLQPKDLNEFAFSYATRNITPEVFCGVLEGLLPYGISGVQTALHIVGMYTHGADEARWRACRPLVQKIVMTKGIFEAPERHQAEHYALEQFAKRLLAEKNAKRLAKSLASEFVRITTKRRLDFGAYEAMRPVAFLLFEHHQDAVWPIFRKALSKANSLSRFHFQHLLERSLTMGNTPKSALLYLTDDRIREWCQDEPNRAPVFIASNIPMFTYDGEDVVPTPLATMLLTEYGSDERVLSAISSNLESFSNMGSLVPAYSQRLEFLRKFIASPNPVVARWAAQHAAGLENRIKSQERRDAERAEGIVVPFFADEMQQPEDLG